MKTRVCLLLPEPQLLSEEEERALFLLAYKAFCGNAASGTRTFCIVGSPEQIGQFAAAAEKTPFAEETEFIALDTAGTAFRLLRFVRRRLKNVVGEYEALALAALEGRKFDLLVHCTPATKKFLRNSRFGRTLSLRPRTLTF